MDGGHVSIQVTGRARGILGTLGRATQRSDGKNDKWIDKCMLAMFSLGLSLFCPCQLAHASWRFTSSSRGRITSFLGNGKKRGHT